MEVWIVFVLAATLVLIVPGPTIILVISQAVTHGRKSVIPLAAGVVLGDFTAMTFSLLGLGALLSASAFLFSIFKWAGAGYLIYLGIRLWMKKPGDELGQLLSRDRSALSLFKSSYIVTALNPKSIAFFIAFLPQFIDSAKPAFQQLTLYGGTFLTIAAINSLLYAAFAGQLKECLNSIGAQRWLNRCGGTALIGAGIITSGMQRSS